MKKKLLGLITFILSAMFAVSCLAGCNLITTDNEKDMNQVVATVNINTEEKIYKKDIVTAYLNYGYAYAQYYSGEQLVNVLVDSLIQSRIVIQNAMEEFENDNSFTKNSSIPKYDVARYLDEEKEVNAKYNTYKTINDLLDSYTETEGDAKKDALIETVRTAPTNASNETKELTLQEKKDYIEAGFDVSSSSARRFAFNSVVKLLENNSLKGSDFEKDGKLESTTYFVQLLKSNMENEIVDIYYGNLEKTARKSVSYNDIAKVYTDTLSEQQEYNAEAFVNALSSLSSSAPILTCGYGTYGFVYNLLLGVNDYQKTAIGEIEEKGTDAYALARKNILANTVIKDLRSTWILSGYDFDGTKFTGDYTFAKDPANSLEFKGTVNLVKEKTDDANAEYSIENVDTFTVNSFVEDMIKGYVYNGVNDKTVTDNVSNDVLVKIECDAEVEEYEEKINELLFAFSTDPGSLNSYKGYLIKPAVDGANQEEFVKTFADAGRELLTLGNKSCIVVASDYGYHVLFYSEVYDVADFVEYDTLAEYLSAKFGIANAESYYNDMVENWNDFEDTDSYLYLITKNIADTKVTNLQNETINDLVYKYRYGEKKDSVKLYQNVYADMLG